MADSFLEILAKLVLIIHSAIYSLADSLYQVFIAISSARIFTADKYQMVANRVYIVIGVAALFFVAYGLLQAIINPDAAGKNDKGVGSVVKNLLVSIALIAFVPAIFNFAYNIQAAVIGSNVIGKLILGEGNTSDIQVNYNENDKLDEDITKAGATLANDIFISFFTPVDENEEPKCINDDSNGFIDCLNGVTSEDGDTLGNTYENVNKTGKFSEYKKYAANVVGDEKTIGFNWLMQFFVGVVLAYVFVSFCIDMGLRTVKLCYYQLIAPIPILTMIIPGQKKIFDNWKKNTISTFLEVFIRITVVFFVLLLIRNLPSLGDPIWNQSLLGEPSSGIKLFAKIFIIIGLLMFMKQAPKLFSDLFGVSSGSFKLGIGEKLGEMAFIGNRTKDVMTRTQGAVSGAAGAGWTAKRNKIPVKQGVKYGFVNGWKSGSSNQFNAQRQQIYSKAFGGEGTAGWFGKRSIFDQHAADINKKAKNAYKSENFNRVLKFEQTPEWKNAYQESYDNVMNKIKLNISEVKAKLSKELLEYDNQEKDIKNRIAFGKNNKKELNDAQLQFDTESKQFENKKEKARKIIQTQYQDAVNKKDISAQLDAQKRLNELNAQTYHNPKLENRIKELKAKDYNVDALETQLKQLQLQRKNDVTIEKYNEQLESYDKDIERINQERDYITKGQLEINGKMVNRSYRTEEEFIKQGGFTDVAKGASESYKREHAEFKDVYDTHNKYLSEVAVTQYMNSEEGQKAIAVREKVERNLQGGSSGKDGNSASGGKK